MHKFKKYITGIGWFLISLGLIYLCFMAVPVKFTNGFEKNVNSFLLSTYTYGVYLTQRPSSIFYNFSPNNVFYIDDDSRIINYGTPERPLFTQESVLLKTKIAPLHKFLQAVTYFNIVNPSATMENVNGSISFKTSVSDNKVTLRVEDNSMYKDYDTAVVLTINRDDEVFDTQGMVYKGQYPELLVDANKEINYSAYARNDLDPNRDYTLILANPEISGLISFPIKKGVYKRVTIDNNDNKIEFVLDKGVEPQVEFETYSSALNYRNTAR